MRRAPASCALLLTNPELAAQLLGAFLGLSRDNLDENGSGNQMMKRRPVAS